MFFAALPSYCLRPIELCQNAAHEGHGRASSSKVPWGKTARPTSLKNPYDRATTCGQAHADVEGCILMSCRVLKSDRVVFPAQAQRTGRQRLRRRRLRQQPQAARFRQQRRRRRRRRRPPSAQSRADGAAAARPHQRGVRTLNASMNPRRMNLIYALWECSQAREMMGLFCYRYWCV